MEPGGAAESKQPSQGTAPAAAEKALDIPKVISHLIVVLDATRSMHHACGDYKRLGIAQWVLSDVLDVAPEEIPTAVLVLQGDVSEKRSLVPLLPSDRSGLRRTTMTLVPQGMGELKECFERVQALLAGHTDARPLLVMVTDGDDCHPGEAHGAAAQLAKQFSQGMVFELIGVGCQDATARQLKSLAQAGGGSYTRVEYQGDLQSALSSVRQECARFATAALRQREAARERLIEKLLGEFTTLRGLIESENKRIDDAKKDLTTLINDKVITAIGASSGAIAGLKTDLDGQEQKYTKLEEGLAAKVEEGTSKITALQKSTKPMLTFYDRVEKLLPKSYGEVLAWVLGALGVTGVGAAGAAVGGGSVVRRGIVALLRQLLVAAEGNLKEAVDQLGQKVQGGVETANEVGRKIDAVPASVKEGVAAVVSPTVNDLSAGLDAVRAEITHSVARAADKIDALQTTAIERINSSERQLAGAIGSVHADVKQSIPAIRQQMTEAVVVPLTSRLGEIETSINSGDHEVQLLIERKVNDATTAISAHSDRVGELLRSNVGQLQKDVAEDVSKRLDAVRDAIGHSAKTLSNHLGSVEKAVSEKVGCAERQLRSAAETDHVDLKRGIAEVTLQLNQTVVMPITATVNEQLKKFETEMRAAHKELSQEARDANGKAAGSIAQVATGVSDVARKCDAAQKSLDAVGAQFKPLKRDLKKLRDELPEETALALTDLRREERPAAPPPAERAA